MHCVADVGNSRVKWGLCADRQVLRSAALPLDDPEAWERQRAAWNLAAGEWAVASVNPPAAKRLSDWLRGQGDRVTAVEDYRTLPLTVAVEQPERVGIDRLLNAVAARARSPGRPAVLVGAGSAVTVDWLDEHGTFRGGAIFPGVRLMAESLHHQTAKLPLVHVTDAAPEFPGTVTERAIAAGIHGAAVGGIRFLADRLRASHPGGVAVYLTGGDAGLLAPALPDDFEHWPLMTLEGLRLAAAPLR
jgi:type III pantothenate kinase